MPTRFDISAIYNDQRINTKTDILEDHPQRQAMQLLIPQIAKLTRNAINVTPVPFEYFQRMKTGRRCSCFTVEDEPQGLCMVCFGTGTVGGFLKRGTKAWVLDVTAPNVMLVNVAPDYDSVARPIHWTLLPTAVYGYLETEIHLDQNIGVVDHISLITSRKEGSSVHAYIKAPLDPDYVLLDERNLQIRLGQRRLKLKIIFTRENPDRSLPILIALRVGYKTISVSALRVDIPRYEESITLEEFGIYESFSSQLFALDNTMKVCTTEDFLYNVEDGLRWKVITASDNSPLGINTSWDLTCRLVQSFEPYAKVPLGNTLQPCKVPPRGVFSMQTVAEETEKCDTTDFKHQQVQELPAKPYNAQQTRGPSAWK